MAKRREYGTGSVDKVDGKYRARAAFENGRQATIGRAATRAEAVQLLRDYSKQRRTGPTFAEFAVQTLDQRERSGIRGIRQERTRYRSHLENWPHGKLAIRDLTPPILVALCKELQGRDRLDGKGKLSHSTVKKVLSLISVICTEAVQTGILETNPADAVRLRKPGGTTKDPFQVLTLSEQKALLSCERLSPYDRLTMAFALGTGLRQGEQWALRKSDIKDGIITARFGSKGLPRKNGKVLRIPLFGIAKEAWEKWQNEIPPNDDGLAFPSPMGCRRQVGKFGRHDRLRKLLRQAGISKNIRWHDFRHTCLTALANGWWGRRWSLPEIKEIAGHSSIAVTQIYVHTTQDALAAAAQGTTGLGLG